jgi:hypothetical protein
MYSAEGWNVRSNVWLHLTHSRPHQEKLAAAAAATSNACCSQLSSKVCCSQWWNFQKPALSTGQSK